MQISHTLMLKANPDCLLFSNFLQQSFYGPLSNFLVYTKICGIEDMFWHSLDCDILTAMTLLFRSFVAK